MPPKQPVFSLHLGSDSESAPASRSTSLDRDLKSPNSQSPQRRPIILHHASSHGSGRHFLHSDPDGLESPCHHLVAVDEEAALEADHGSAGYYEPGEHDSLLARGRQPDRGDAPSRRRLTWSSGYGATHSGGGHAAAHQHEPAEGGGATIKRQESILRVAGLIDDRSGEYEKYRKSDKDLDKMSKKLRKFYEKQNETLVRDSSPRTTCSRLQG